MVVSVQHLVEQFLAVRIAERRRSTADPQFRLRLSRQIRQSHWSSRFRAPHRRVVGRVGRIVPARRPPFTDTSAAFRETRIAKVTVRRHNHLTFGSLHRFHHIRVRCVRDPLVALAVIICTNIEERMIRAVIPADQFPVAA